MSAIERKRTGLVVKCVTSVAWLGVTSGNFHTLKLPPLRSLRQYTVLPSGLSTGLRSSPARLVRFTCLPEPTS